MQRKLLEPFQYLWRNGLWLGRQLFRRAPIKTKVILDGSELIRGVIVLRGCIVTNLPISKCHVIVRKFRDETLKYENNVDIDHGASNSLLLKFGHWIGVYKYTFAVTLSVPWGLLPSSIYNLRFQVDGKRLVPQLSRGAQQILIDETANRTYYLFKEPSMRVPRIEVYHFGQKVLDQLGKIASTPYPKSLTCVIGEYTNTARDNGMVLFEEIKTRHSDIQASYIIEAKNVEGYAVDQEGVHIFGSPEHLASCLMAKVCAFTHHRTYVYPAILQEIAPKRYAAARTLFLQHGIIGLKREILTHLHHDRVQYDAFCVSSEWERAIVAEHFQYAQSKVHVTGLARFDYLLNAAKEKRADPTRILIFPTWQKSLQHLLPQEIAESEFAKKWRTVMESLQTLGLHTVLILHPIFRDQESVFQGYTNETGSVSEFQKYLTSSSAIVTDYSSVCFDALLLQKPVFIFNPDIGEQQDQGFISEHSEQPGEICDSLDVLKKKISEARDQEWAFTHSAARNLFFERTDAKNVERNILLLRKLAEGI